MQHLEHCEKVSFFLKLGCLAEVSLEKLSTAIHTFSKARVRHGKIKTRTAGTANVHTHTQAHTDAQSLRVGAHCSTQGQTPLFPIDKQPLPELPLFLVTTKITFTPNTGIVSYNHPLGVCFQHYAGDCAQGAMLRGASWSSVTYAEGEGRFDNGTTAPNERNAHLTISLPSLQSLVWGQLSEFRARIQTGSDEINALLPPCKALWQDQFPLILFLLPIKPFWMNFM